MKSEKAKVKSEKIDDFVILNEVKNLMKVKNFPAYETLRFAQGDKNLGLCLEY